MSWKAAPWVKAKAPKQRKRVNRISASLAAELKLYIPEARAFVANLNAKFKSCPVVTVIGLKASSRITEVHHKYGRTGRLLRWQKGWLGVSRAGHIWIDAHRDEARKHGWLAPEGLYNDFKRAQIAEVYGTKPTKSCTGCDRSS